MSTPSTSAAKPSICLRISIGARCKYTRSIVRSGRSIAITDQVTHPLRIGQSLHLQLPAAYVLQTTTNRRLGLWSNLYGHESARSGLAGASLEQSSTLEYRLRVVQRAQREPMCARIVLQTLTGPYGRFNVRQPELLPLCHQLLRHACPSSTMTRSLHIPPTARKNAVYGALTVLLTSNARHHRRANAERSVAFARPSGWCC